MDSPPVRLQMIVSEPWDFGSGTVEMTVLDAADKAHWIVEIQDCWPTAIGAVLSCRYEGQTLADLLDGGGVIANLSAKLDGRSEGLIGTVSQIA
jgi:hypothetical protein